MGNVEGEGLHLNALFAFILSCAQGDFMDEKTLFSFDVENWRTEENLRESTQVRLVGSTFEDQPERISNPGKRSSQVNEPID